MGFFRSRNPSAHIQHRVVPAPRLTRPTRHLTKKSPSCLRKGEDGMNLEVMRTGTFCCFKYVSLILSHITPTFTPLLSACTRPSRHPHPLLDPPMFQPPTSLTSVQARELHAHCILLLMPKSSRPLPRLGYPRRTAHSSTK